jgi:hypothetical protein
LIRLARSSVVASHAVHLAVLGLVTGWPLVLSAQDAKPASAPAPANAPSPPTVGEAWDSLLQGAIPQATPDPVLIAPQAPVQRAPAGDFANHFFLEDRTDYFRYDASFTGLATNTGIINATPTGAFNPAGYPDPAVFQPNSNRIETFLDFGTRGWLSDRVNTHFAFVYDQDLSHVDQGAPAEGILETFGSNRFLQAAEASIEIDGKPTDGFFAGTTLTLGRQYVYGAEVASIDGVDFTFNRPTYALTVFGGRRFTFFSDPDQRALGGAGFTYKISPDVSIQWDGIWYIHGENALTFRRRINTHWLVSTYFRTYGGSPVDFSLNGLYDSGDGKTSLRVGFFQKLTANDYEYDFTDAATNLASNAQLLRLYLGPFEQYSQVSIDARRTINSRLNLGGSVLVRQLNNTHDEGPFDTSFQDYRINGQIFPWRKIETFLEYHQRNSDRLNPINATAFDDLSATGETSVKDLEGDVRRTFGERGRFSLSGGVYYRRVSLQDRFYYLNGLHQSGWLAGAQWKVDDHARLFLDYDLDNDFFLLQPDLKDSRALHVGIKWKY